MAIGRWKSICINVTDLDQGLDFWSEVLGWEPTGRWHGWLGYLRDPDSSNFMILNDVTKAPVNLNPPTHNEANRVHIDIWPIDGMDNAVQAIVALGGRVKKSPSLYPRPGSYGDEAPRIDWTVMQDPFGNEFCIVEMLTPDQSAAAMSAGMADDHALRVAVGKANG